MAQERDRDRMAEAMHGLRKPGFNPYKGVIFPCSSVDSVAINLFTFHVSRFTFHVSHQLQDALRAPLPVRKTHPTFIFPCISVCFRGH